MLEHQESLKSKVKLHIFSKFGLVKMANFKGFNVLYIYFYPRSFAYLEVHQVNELNKLKSSGINTFLKFVNLSRFSTD
jgi:hypothetical protein